MTDNMTKVSTKNHKLTIDMNSMASKHFILNTAIVLLLQCRDIQDDVREVVGHDDQHFKMLNVTYKDEDYPGYLDLYTRDDTDELMTHMWDQNATILFKFIEDCVKNGIDKDTFDWLYESGYTRPVWDLILTALNIYTNRIRHRCELLDIPFPPAWDYARYNQQFCDLI